MSTTSRRRLVESISSIPDNDLSAVDNVDTLFGGMIHLLTIQVVILVRTWRVSFNALDTGIGIYKVNNLF